MTWANAAINDVIATTIESRSGVLHDNLTNNNAFLRKLRERGNTKPVSGGYVIREEIMYPDNGVTVANSFSGYETLNVSDYNAVSAAQFDIKQYYSYVSMSDLEVAQNSGEEQIIDLLEGKISVAEAELMNRIDADLYGDGTGNGGKALTGLGAMLPIVTNTGNYGGIDRANWAFWRNQSFRGVTDGGAAVSASNIQAYLTAIAIRCIRGQDSPDLILMDANYYNLYNQSLVSIQRVASDQSAGAGFVGLKFYGGGIAADVVMAGGVGAGIPANRAFVLNTKYACYRPHRNFNFTAPTDRRMAVNQAAFTQLMFWFGNLTSRGPQFSGVLSA